MNEPHELVYFKMQMLNAKIHMNAMIAENKLREATGSSPAFTEDDFIGLIYQYGIHHSAFPFYRRLSMDSLDKPVDLAMQLTLTCTFI